MFLAAAAVFGGTAWSIAAFARQRSDGPADAAVVLGAAVHGDEPSPVFRERINHGIELYRAGKVRKLIFTGGSRTGASFPEAEAARKYALRQGVSAEDILTEASSTTTQENLRFVRLLAEHHGLRSFLLVSDPLHMKRACHLAADAGLEAEPSPTPTTMYRSWSSRARFLGRETWYYLRHVLTGG